MKFSLLISLVILTVSCGSPSEKPAESKEEASNEIVGTWKLTESLIDIGDGNGSYQKVTSAKTMTFNADGSVLSNQNVCMGNSYSAAKAGKWDVTAATLSSGDCTASLEIKDGMLQISYQCMEACGERFERVD